ncbi:hypothetical protein ISF9_058 [Microbacterium phage vB_MoxS-ISF9]|uniref:Uncharacterized protein n=1 Tax=Microbacterium phage vB_MoxS-ISF9 TaxID=1458670 RepID=W8NWM8_9CAUD|nr:hypothetical protein ISF9_058 [Microbacterium phage vB_MoxS-ISF9]AHL18528.1 hypothetical protein ISF9_058 [Microbacterium phage vB_MoxS-ISF9]
MFSTSDIYALARKAASAVEGEGAGHTIYARGSEARRYVVGGYTPSVLLPVGTPVGVVRRAIRRMVGAHGARFAETLGYWEDSGTVYLDLGTTYHDEVSALSVARTRGELAIYDREAGEVTSL